VGAWRRGGRSSGARRFITDSNTFVLTDIERSQCSHPNHALEVDVVATMSGAWENTVGGRRHSEY
jgi:hypothetical protein